MSTSKTGVDTLPSAVVVPEPNDIDYYVTAKQAFIDLLNSVTHHKNTFQGTGDTDLRYVTDADVTAIGPTVQHLFPHPDRARGFYIYLANILGRVKYEADRINTIRSTIAGFMSGSRQTFAALGTASSADWTNHSGANASSAPYVLQNSISHINVKIPIPPQPVGATISQIDLLVRSPSSHGGALPLSMPQAQLYRAGGNTATATAIGSAGADASANATAYEAEHFVSITGLSELIGDATQWYYLSVRGESSTNAVATSFRVYSVSIQYNA